MSESRIELVPFTKTDNVLGTARRLASLVDATEERLRNDFPSVITGCRDEESALRWLYQNVRRMEGAKGRYCAYLVTVNDEIMGVVTIQQRWLTVCRRFGPFRWKMPIMYGPLIAVWLGDVLRPRKVLPRVLDQVARAIAFNFSLKGTPWALVRPRHVYARSALSGGHFGFGGFDSFQPPQDFTHIDGAEGLRVAYRARVPVHALNR